MPSRATANLPVNLERNLKAYTTAAGALGVTMLTLASPAAAEVVYTPAHVQFGSLGVSSYQLDVNNDGVGELRIGSYFSCDLPVVNRSGSCFYILSANAVDFGNQVLDSEGLRFARALKRGAIVGPTKSFGRRGSMIFGFFPSFSTSYNKAGEWINVKNRYLGLRFKLDGKLHYSWARLTVGLRSSGPRRMEITGVLTGYAYETDPDTPIKAGDKGGGASLGRLALGTAGKH